MRSHQLTEQPMANVDKAWLRMDSPDNPMVINGVLFVENAISRAEFVALVKERILQPFLRFRQRPVIRQRKYFWQECQDLDLEYHIPELTDPQLGAWTEASFKRACGDLVSRPLETDKPLWRFYFAPDYNGGSAVCFRIHHAYGDGLALISVLDSFSDQSVLDSSPAAKFKFPSYQPKSNKLVDRALFGITSAARTALFAGAWAYEAGRVTLQKSDSDTRFKQPLSKRKNVAWGESLPVADVKAVAKALGCTLNDVVLGCVAGSLRQQLLRSGADVNQVSIRAMVPVNLRPLHEASKLGNEFGLVYLTMPVSECTAEDRIRAVRKHMKSLKTGVQAIMSYQVVKALGHLPSQIEHGVKYFFSTKASAIMSNVPGPEKPVVINGKKVLKPMFWVPQSGSIGVGVSIFSYNHQVEFGFLADSDLVPNTQELVDDVITEFETLRQRLNIESVRAPKQRVEIAECDVDLMAG